MNKKLTVKDWLKCFNENRIAVLIIVILAITAWQFVYYKVTAYKPQETVNFAVGVFAWSDNALEENVRQELKQDGIEKVTMGYYSADDINGLSGYLATYGVNEADIFLVDLPIEESLLDGCMTALSQDEIAEITSKLSFTPKLVERNGEIIGIVVHKKGDDGYNGNFASLHKNMLFSGDGEEYDYAIYVNAKTVHREISIKALGVFLEMAQ